MKLAVEIKTEQVQTFEGISSKTGKPYCIRKQQAWLDLGKDYPVEIELNLEANKPPYKLGLYTLSSESFYVDRNRQLSVRPVLVPAVQPVDKKAG